MDRAIAVDWGRFLREAEAQRTEGLKNNDNGNADAGKVRQEGSKQAVWQRLQEVIATPAVPEVPLFDEPVSPPAAPAADRAQQDTGRADRSFLESFARPPAEIEKKPEWLKTPPALAPSAPEPQNAAGENGTFQMRTLWVGTGFEERRVLITPPRPEPPAPQPQQVAAFEAVPVEATPLYTPPADAPEAPDPQQAAMREEDPAQTASFMPDQKLEEKMWIPTAQSYTPAPTEASSNGTKTLQSSYDHDASRWYMLHGMLGGSPSPQEPPSDAPAPNVPVLEVFSLAGGVGKTSLVAALGRALSARGENVLLVEATPFGSLPYFFGASDCRPGALRTFRPPASSNHAPIRMATIDPDALMDGAASHGSIAAEIQGWVHGVSRVIVDVATRSTAMVRELSRMSPVVLVPLLPDINAVLTANSIENFFEHNVGAAGAQTDVYFVLNQFDPSLPLHLDVLQALRERLGKRLLPFALERTPAVSEALAEGMTVMDYAPETSLADDFSNLAKWIEVVMAPADINAHGMRWSER